ncbi:MAG TPA: Sec-independent protein translocase protein TatB [Povalibacter sp.]
MFEVGFSEIVLILGLALLVLGPEKLPGLAQKVGRWTGRARAMARQLRTQLEQEVTIEEMAKSRPMQSGPHTAAPPEEPPAETGHTIHDVSSPAEEAPVASAESAPEPADASASPAAKAEQ